jgi:UDP-galactopyranose mutase
VRKGEIVKYDFVIVGAGLFGSVFARELTDAGKRVLIVDQRDHIGGNVYTKNVHGINVHMYGPHIFHTNSERIWRYVNRFAAFNHYVHRVKAYHTGTVYSMPINLMTLQQLWAVRTPAEAAKRLDEVRIPCANPRNLEEWALSQVGEEIYRKFIYGYTRKQWRRDPSTLPASIIKRLPIRLNYDDNYFNDRYQGIPIGGYTALVENLLDGIRPELGTSFADLGDWRRYGHTLVFTGKIDEYFGSRFGPLEYRSLEFKNQVHTGDFQGVAQMNYTDANVPYTRIVEHKHFEFGKQERSVISYEYPVEWVPGRTPYYPINDAINVARYKRYQQEAALQKNVIFGGRLAEYRYYDMHQVIGSALVAARRVCGDKSLRTALAPSVTVMPPRGAPQTTSSASASEEGRARHGADQKDAASEPRQSAPIRSGGA